jgi:mRNA-degrading endonuclease RelE of RelBE toxin-antitoxin system
VNNKPVNDDIFKFLKQLPLKQQNQILHKIIKLVADPVNHGGEKLSGYDNYYKMPVGEYRICYTIIDSEISIDLCDKRNDSKVYEKLSRKKTK